MAIKHSWLPQITADYDYLLNGLDSENVGFKLDKFKPTDLTPLTDNINTLNVQGIKDSIYNQKPVNPIIISKDNEVLDGHDRLFGFKSVPDISQVLCIKIYLDKHEASRILNKLEDKYNWEKSLDDNFETQNSLSEEDVEEPKNVKELTLYSNKPLTANKHIGNFLLQKENQSYKHPYSISFENLFEMDDAECESNPIETLGRRWFFNYDDFKVEAAKSVLTHENYILKKIHSEAIKKGYDGIKYGSKFIQTIDK